MNVGNDLLGVHLWLVELDDVAFLVDEELGPAPRQVGRVPGCRIVQLRMSSEVHEDRVSVWAIGIQLFQDRESSSVSVSGQGVDALSRPLLLVKRVTWNSNDLESLVLELLMHLN